MSTSALVINEPIDFKGETILNSLQETFETLLDLWSYTSDSEWIPRNRLVDESKGGFVTLDNAAFLSIPKEKLLSLFDLTREQCRPNVLEMAEGQHLLAVPLVHRGKSVENIATAVLQTNSPQLLVHLAKMTLRSHGHQEEIAQLREENDYFLTQVSDDFEELSFLRSMAEQLGLENEKQHIGQLINSALPTLLGAIYAESLYLIPTDAHGSPTDFEAWNVAEGEQSNVDRLQLQWLVETYQSSASTGPIVKNSFDSIAEGERFPDVHSFMLVSAATTMGQLGWFLAINRRTTTGTLTAGNIWQLSQSEFGTSEATLLSTAGTLLASHANNLELFREKEELLVGVVRTMVSAIDSKDPYTCGHSERVALYARRLAEQLGYDEQSCKKLYLTGLLHDVGKIGVSDAILNKPGQLTDEEFAEIKRHSDEGWAILQELEPLQYVLPGVLHHHERHDGDGYPDRLAGEHVPMDGRILAVVDAYDAMTSSRAYRQGMPQEKAESILREGAGSQWDKDIVHAFFEIMEDIVAIRGIYQQRERAIRQPADNNTFYEGPSACASCP